MQQPESVSIVLSTPEATGLRDRAAGLLERARALRITGPDQYNVAGEELVGIKTVVNSIRRLFAEPKKKAHEAHVAITQAEGKLLAIPTEAERLYKIEMGRFLAEHERQQREQERQIQEQLKRQEEDRRLTEAQTLAETGHQAEAESLLDRPVLAPVVEMQPLKAAGVSTREKFAFRIVDPAAIKREYLTPDEKKIGKLVDALGADAVGVVGGIEVYTDKVVSVRAQS